MIIQPNKIIVKTNHVVIGILVLLVVILAYKTFNSRPKPADPKEVIEAKNETIRILQQQRIADSIYIEKDLQRERQKDSIVLAAINENQPKYKPLNKRYENIPGSVRSLSKDSLRRAIFEE